MLKCSGFAICTPLIARPGRYSSISSKKDFSCERTLNGIRLGEEPVHLPLAPRPSFSISVCSVVRKRWYSSGSDHRQPPPVDDSTVIPSRFKSFWNDWFGDDISKESVIRDKLA